MSRQFPEYPVLMVDDEETILSSQDTVLRSNGITNLISCADSREVMGIVRAQPIEVILLDLSMPHVSGEDLLPQLQSEFPSVPVIVITGTNEVQSAVQCMQAGAFDYLVKAVDRDRLLCAVRRAIEVGSLRRRYTDLRRRMLQDELRCPEAFAGIVTDNRKMHSIFLYVESVAASRETVLIRGETGVGKELFALAVHVASGRTGEFVAVNTAGLDDSMFSDTLFGHREGAYTGASGSRSGLVRQAAGGTLFLDEVGDLSEANQTKLLRLLEKREYYPLGSDLAKSTDARFVVATSVPLEDRVREGRFRMDLFYRLSTHDIRIPPLRERKDDLPLLLQHFVREACEELGKEIPRIPQQIYGRLEACEFPGNVRELRSMVYDAAIRHSGPVLSPDAFLRSVGNRDAPLPEGPGGAPPVAFGDQLPSTRQVVQLLVEEALRRSGGNQALAAGLIGVSPQALSKRLHKQRHSRLDGTPGCG